MKSKKPKLAISGGPKTIKKKGPHFIWPPIDKKLEKVVIKQFHKSISIYNKSGVFKEFEDAFAKYYHRKHVLLCSSGTLAIHSMFVAAGFKEGDEVICPAYTFFATVTSLLFTGAKPILCDIDENGNINPQEVKKKITKRTKGVIITHMWGIPCKMDKIVKICKENNLLLLEDCSHAHGTRYKGKLVGTFGDLATWSLQGPKIISSGEGGILVTDNKEFYYRALLLGHYNKRCKQEIPKDYPFYKYTVTGMGLKYRVHPLAIVIAYEQFKNLEKYLKIKRFFAQKMIQVLKNKSGISLLPAFFDKNLKPSWYAFLFQYKSQDFQDFPIEKFFEALQIEGLIEIDRPSSTCFLNYLPLFQSPTELFPIYKKYSFSYKQGDSPKAEKFYQNAIKLPVWAFKKDLKMVSLYLLGIQKVINSYRDLL